MEEICKSTEKLKLSNLLLVDLLNYNHKFFGSPSKNVKPYKSLKTVFDRVAKFVAKAEVDGWRLEVFIDDAIATEETLKKWNRRREKEGNSIDRIISIANIVSDEQKTRNSTSLQCTNWRYVS